jgi:integrase
MQTVPSLKRNKSGWFEIRWSEKDDTGAWRSQRKSTHTKDQAQAIDELRRHLGNPTGLSALVAGVAQLETIGELLDQYEQSAEMRGVKATQGFALRPIRRAWDALAPEDISPGVVREYTQARMRGEYTERRMPAQSATIRRELVAFGAAMRWCVRKKLIKPEQCPDVDLPPNGAPRERFLTQTEVDDLLQRALAFDKRVYLFCRLAIDTCARADAIETLTWDRVDTHRGMVDYRDPALPVTTKRREVVPVSDHTRHVLRTLKPGPSMRGGPSGLVVGPIPYDFWKRFTDTTPYKDLTRHDLRRTGASLLVHRGVDLMKVAKMLGDDPQTVIRHYARFAPDYLADVHRPTP